MKLITHYTYLFRIFYTYKAFKHQCLGNVIFMWNRWRGVKTAMLRDDILKYTMFYFSQYTVTVSPFNPYTNSQNLSAV